MQLICLGSSSKGNCYILQNATEALLIECGVKISEIKLALNFSFAKVAGCVLTHEHGDHAASINEVMKFGINVYTSRGTMRALGLPVDHHRLKVFDFISEDREKKLKKYPVVEIGPFKVQPFQTEHDVAEPVGFVIYHPECGSVLFITDSIYVKDTFKNINNVIIEANFSHEIINKRVQDGASPDFLRNRIFKSHMSLETCKETLKGNDLSKVHNIVLIHLSDGNSNAAEFQKEVEGMTGKKVTVADAGIVIENFNKTAF